MGITTLVVLLVLIGSIILFGFAVVQGMVLRKYSTAIKMAGNLASGAVIIVLAAALYKIILRWTRIQAFRAWKQTLRGDWRLEIGDDRGLWSRFWLWVAKDRRSEKWKKKGVEYEMVNAL